MRRGLVRVGVTLGVLSTSLFAHQASAPALAEQRPNIIVIVSDDQRWDSLWAMPILTSTLGDKGVTFANAFVPNAVCCPSRASILTGTYSHTNGVWTNQNGPYGGFTSFDDSSTLATWLQASGYRTALMGKYLNGYQQPGRETLYVPPGWDRWWSFVGGKYYGYTVNDDGALRTYGTEESDYVMDAMTDEAEAFIRGSEDPFFLFFTPKAPHLPATPAARHADAFPDLEAFRPPSWNEAGVKDKPKWVQRLAKLSTAEIAATDAKRLDMYRSLLALDESVGRIVQTLEETGELQNTMIMFISDNGYSWGEHRWVKKSNPYEEVIRVPLLIRYDAMTSGGWDEERFALNIDLAPTIAEVAGVEAPAMDGKSLVPILQGQVPDWRRDFLIEHYGVRVPSYCGVRADQRTYVYYSTGEQELYDLSADPYQLINVAGRPAYRDDVDALHRRLTRLCDSPPPGMTLPG